jgi:sigma-B regulation protein RsbU (phosphoserine phosphatase)
MTVSHGDERARTAVLYELTSAFAEELELDELVPLIMQKCREVLAAEGAAVLLLDRETNELYFPYVGLERSDVAAELRNLRFPADRGIAGAVLRSGKSLRVDDVMRDSRFYGGIDARTRVRTRALLTAPLRCRDGTIGVLQVVNPVDGGAFDDGDVAFLDALASNVAVLVENAKLYSELKTFASELEQKVEERTLELRDKNEALTQAMAQLEEAQRILRRELDVAHDIQMSMLPKSFPDDKAFELYAAMWPAREVGGDLYDFFPLDDRRWGIVIGDVSGKGVPAALFMAVTRTLLKSTALQGLAPGPCLTRVNRLLCQENRLEMFVTLFYGVLSRDTGELRYANGGHNPPFLLRASGGIEEIAPTGDPVLGMLDAVEYTTSKRSLQPGDALLLYTDGVTEAMNADGSTYDEARLCSALAAQHAAPPRTLVERVLQDVRRFAGDTAQADDIAMLAVRRQPDRRPPGDDELTIRVRNDTTELESVAEVVSEFAAARSMPQERLFQLKLAVDEILSNVIMYAFEPGEQHEITIHLSSNESAITVTIEDDGRFFDPRAVPEAETDASIDERPIGGLGLHLARKSVDRLDYRRIADKNQVVLIKFIAAERRA